MPVNSVNRGMPARARDFNRLAHRSNEAWVNLSPNSAWDQAPLPGSAEAVVCMAANDSETLLETYQSTIIRGTWSVAGDRNTLLYVTPWTADDPADRLAICLEEIPPGGVGRICIAGICWAQGDGSSGSYATPNAVRTMTCGASGPAQVLAQDSGLLLVRFPIASSGNGTAIFPPHGHQGFFDGGYFGGMGGGL